MNMTKARKLVRYTLSVSGFLLVVGLLLRSSSVGGALKVVVGLVFLYGAVILAGALAEMLWRRILRVAELRRVAHPRIAASVSLACAVVLSALSLSILGTVPAGRVIVRLLVDAFVFVGGCATVGKWLASGWEATSSLIHRRNESAHGGAV